mmetsp:Transcript_30961/g.100859  ORF Transcript_30961/g.100859 Transcript_30961/m.100859 type:complete len:249 (-) Transcript_30961:143-889(-)
MCRSVRHIPSAKIHRVRFRSSDACLDGVGIATDPCVRVRTHVQEMLRVTARKLRLEHVRNVRSSRREIRRRRLSQMDVHVLRERVRRRQLRKHVLESRERPRRPRLWRPFVALIEVVTVRIAHEKHRRFRRECEDVRIVGMLLRQRTHRLRVEHCILALVPFRVGRKPNALRDDQAKLFGGERLAPYELAGSPRSRPARTRRVLSHERAVYVRCVRVGENVPAHRALGRRRDEILEDRDCHRAIEVVA